MTQYISIEEPILADNDSYDDILNDFKYEWLKSSDYFNCFVKSCKLCIQENLSPDHGNMLN